MYEAVRPLWIWREPLDKCTQSLIFSCHGLCSIRANTHIVLPFQCSESSETQHTEKSFSISYQIHCDSKTERSVVVFSRFGFLSFTISHTVVLASETLHVFLFAPVRYLCTLQVWNDSGFVCCTSLKWVWSATRPKHLFCLLHVACGAPHS